MTQEELFKNLIAHAKEYIRKITRELKTQTNITISYEGPKWAYLQALLSRGDRNVLEIIIEMAKREMNAWQEILKQWHMVQISYL